MYQLVFYVPKTHLNKVKQAIFLAGGGKFKNYDSACWQSNGIGQFRPLANSEPFIGEKNKLELVYEYKVELMCQDQYIENCIIALQESHPYEEPAYAAWKVEYYG